ncbi:hypothetical protein vBVhaSMAG7_039 [Vibrio phage vB_VhaS_MAG7]|nr:hypothetical protein vBVhaSMAG7_039 [Vibrio phage vB_VhaS_MAG7]
MSLNLWKAALPQSRMFSLIITKTLRLFYQGLTYPQYYRDLFDTTYKQLDPQVTDNLLRWEDQFYLPSSGLTEQERRDRLEATWRMTGGQSPAYLQSILRGYGFDVYVHDWWLPDGELVNLTMGDDEAVMGGEFAVMGADLINTPVPWNPNELLISPYYPLVNRISSDRFQPLTMGSDDGFMGSDDGFMGNLVEVSSSEFYPIPADPVKWRGFVYVAGETMPNTATVPLARQDEFEELILSIFPADKWVGVLVDFV